MTKKKNIAAPKSDRCACVILAAGKGVRMKSELPKVLHEVCGKPMISYSVDLAVELGCGPIVVVLGNGAALVKKILPENVGIAIQEKQLGTGHAAQCGIRAIVPQAGSLPDRVLILYGDTPLLTKETISKFLEAHRDSGKTLAMLTAKMPPPNKLGRVIRNKYGVVERIVEVSDATPEELAIEEVNAGIYAADFDFIEDALDRVKPDNAQGEYYLTDVVAMAAKKRNAMAYTIDDYMEALGVNDRIELSEAERAMNRRTLKRLMLAGVTVLDPLCTYIQPTVEIGSETKIYPGAIIEGTAVIGAGCVIGPGVLIRNSRIGNGVEIRAHSVVDTSRIGDNSTIGPSAHLRPESDIGPNCRIGNFVETKKASLGEGTKASHLTYLGDAIIGKNVNIGCGTITCNYDGNKKHLTEIEDDVFVGSDTQLIAPIKVGKGAYIGSGSTITQNVEPGALAVARAKQRDIPGGGFRMMRKKKS